MTRSEFAERLYAARVKANMAVEQLDYRVHASRGTVAQLEAGIAQVPDESLVAALAEALGVWPSELDSRFDATLNHTGRNFARVCSNKGFRPIEAKALWDAVFDNNKFRGVVPEEVWQRFAREIAQQGELPW